MHALLIAETTPKLMKLAAFARTTAPDVHWTTATTGAFSVAVDKVDTKNQQPRLKLKHKLPLNRIITMAADVNTVYLATDPNGRGELLAADVAEQLLGRYPELQVYRLRLDRLTSPAFRKAFAASSCIDQRTAESMRVARMLNFLVQSRTQQLTGRPGGRAVLPLLAEVAGMQRPGQARIRLRLASGLELLSDFGPVEQVADVFEQVRTHVPVMDVRSEKWVRHPPARYDVNRLQQDGCRLLGMRGIEVASQTEQLYCGGYIARDHVFDADYVMQARSELEAFGDAPAEMQQGKTGAWIESLVVSPCIVPVNLPCLPSDVPKPVRPVYRLIWANTLCSFAQPMHVRVDSVELDVDGLRFRGEATVPLSLGFDNVSFGLFYCRGSRNSIGDVRDVEDARMFGGGPFESEVLQRLTMPLRSPAVTIRAAENAGYIGFDGPELVVLEYGETVLQKLRDNVPQLLDDGMFTATELYLESDRDVRELVGPWCRWAEQVSTAVKKRGVAYLR